MTRERIEPVPVHSGHDGPCQDCQDTYRRTMIATAVVTFTVSLAGLAGVVAWARSVR